MRDRNFGTNKTKIKNKKEKTLKRKGKKGKERKGKERKGRERHGGGVLGLTTSLCTSA